MNKKSLLVMYDFPIEKRGMIKPVRIVERIYDNPIANIFDRNHGFVVFSQNGDICGRLTTPKNFHERIGRFIENKSENEVSHYIREGYHKLKPEDFIPSKVKFANSDFNTHKPNERANYCLRKYSDKEIASSCVFHLTTIPNKNILQFLSYAVESIKSTYKGMCDDSEYKAFGKGYSKIKLIQIENNIRSFAKSMGYRKHSFPHFIKLRVKQGEYE